MTPREYEQADAGQLSDGERSLFDVVMMDSHSTARLPQGNYFFWGGVPHIEGVGAGRMIDDQVIFNWDDTHPILRHVAVETLFVYEWLYKFLAGIRPEASAVGFDRFSIAPTIPQGLEWVEADYESARGTISSCWRLAEGLLYFDVETPVNTTAVLQLPTRGPTSVREGGRLLAEVSSIRRLPTTSPDAVRVELGSGRYSFTALAP